MPTFQIKESIFRNNYASLYGGAIFFASYVFPSFIWKANVFENNFARYYGNNWASSPFRLVLTSTNISLNNFTEEQILNFTIKIIKMQSYVDFGIDYYVWIIDQFFQPSFSNIQM